MKRNKWNIIVPLLSILATLCMGAMIKQTATLTSFNAGEMSPLMNSRVDFAKYKSGAQTLQNMIVRAQGPVTRRPGTKYIATVKDSTDATRLIPFEYSTTDAYVLELGDEYVRFYRNGAQVLSGQSAYEVASPWDPNDLFEIQFAQDAQYMRLVHPDYKPRKLTRNSASHTDWSLSAITFVDGPFLDENETESSTITPDATTGDVNLVATGGIFDADHVGALWQISHLVDSNSVTGRWRAVGTYDYNTATITVFENQTYTVTTGGTWWGTLSIQRSYDDGTTWNDVKPFYSYHGSGNVVYSGIEEEDDALYRLHMEDMQVSQDAWDNGLGECVYSLSTDTFTRRGTVTITAYTDANNVAGTVGTSLASTEATWRWAEGVWSDYRGWPRTIEHHEQRCVYGGNTDYPQAIWASVTSSQDSDYDDFDEGTGAEDDAWTYILPGMNPIQWLKSHDYLMVGTSGGVGRLGTTDKPINPTWPPTYRLQSEIGSAYIQAVHAVDALLYVERGGEKIREVSYTYAADRYIAQDMTILAEHILEGGAVQIDFQDRPDPILWVVRSDGVLCSFTYQRHHSVEAWARQTTGTSDSFESVARIPGSTDEDEIWAVVQRTIDSNSLRYVEQFQPFDWGTDQNDCWFADCGNTDPNSLSHLEGATVVLFADGRPVEANTYTVSSGALSPAASGYTNTNIGLPYTSILETMPLTVGLNGATSLGRWIRVLSLTADFYETLGCHIGPSSSYTADLKFSDDSFATTMEVFSGVKYLPYPRQGSRSPAIYLTETSPVPCTVRNFVADIEVTVE
jgi:hypothetical protein